MTAVSQQQEYEPTRSITQDLSLSTPDEKGTSKDLLQLKKQLHHLEVESRVLLQDNNRYNNFNNHMHSNCTAFFSSG